MHRILGKFLSAPFPGRNTDPALYQKSGLFITFPRVSFAKTRGLPVFHRNLLKNMVEWYLLLHPWLPGADMGAEDYYD